MVREHAASVAPLDAVKLTVTGVSDVPRVNEQSLLTKGSRAAAQSIRAGARQMSSATEAEAKEQMLRWTTISKAMIAGTGVFTVYNIFSHFGGHHEHHEAPAFAYLKLRNKPFPWELSGCDLLDSHCKELARAAKQALKDDE